VSGEIIDLLEKTVEIDMDHIASITVEKNVLAVPISQSTQGK
jgi:hypothetical protein